MIEEKKQIKLAVIILNWNGKGFLQRFLSSVIKTCPGYARVFVADNGSSDGSCEFLEKHFPDASILPFEKNYGYTGGYNRALQQIDAQYYTLLNSDIETPAGWISPIIDFMDAHPEVAACQPKILSWDRPAEFEYAGAAGVFIDQFGYPFCRGRIFATTETDHGQYDQITDVFWATGACMFVRGKDFFEAGMLDDDFFAHMEEIDLCWRLKRMGKRVVFVPGSKVYHVGGGTLQAGNPRKTFLNFRNNLLLLAKNTTANRFYKVMLFRLLLDNIAALKFLLSGKFRDSMAIGKAWVSIARLWRKKRKQGRAISRNKVSGIYLGCIVWDYYVSGKKIFSRLSGSGFTKAL